MKQSWASYFRHCALCGEFWGKIDLFCGVCFKTHIFSKLLTNDHPNFAQMDYSFPVFSLFRWTKQNAAFDSIGFMVKRLKGNCPNPFFEKMAMLFVQERSRRGRLLEPVFIPAPPTKSGEKDHAYYWAQELAKHWKTEIFSCLEHSSERPQKTKKKLERQRVFTLSSDLIPKNRTIIFCDDVITTGSTAKAAFQALKKPELFEVWTIACRTLTL